MSVGTQEKQDKGPSNENVEMKDVSGNNLQAPAGTYKVYAERWLVLAVCCFLALSNAMQWISYSSLIEHAEVYFRGKNTTADSKFGVSFVTNSIFQFVAVITGLAGMYITDNWGILVASLLGTSLNILGSVIRVISSLPMIHSFLGREVLLHAGSFIVAGAQAFFLVLPSKIAECWFAEDQRAVANVLSFMSNPGGVALGTVIPSLLFGSDTSSFKTNSWTFFIYNFGMMGLALLPFVMSLFLRRSVPKTPPSASSANHKKPPAFWRSILDCLINVQFLIQMVNFGLAFSLLWSVQIFIPPVLDGKGYNLQGYPTAAAAIVGTATSLLAGHIADKTKRFKEILRFCTVGFALSTVALRFYLLRRAEHLIDPISIMLISALMGAFSTPQFPIGVEMGVETTFPVLEATSSGLLVLFAQLCMFSLSYLLEMISGVDWIYGKENGLNWKLSLDVVMFLSFFAVFMSIVFMRPKYRRLELESSVNHPSMDTTRTTLSTSRSPHKPEEQPSAVNSPATTTPPTLTASNSPAQPEVATDKPIVFEVVLEESDTKVYQGDPCYYAPEPKNILDQIDGVLK